MIIPIKSPTFPNIWKIIINENQTTKPPNQHQTTTKPPNDD